MKLAKLALRPIEDMSEYQLVNDNSFDRPNR
jgi:hypothetical protein